MIYGNFPISDTAEDAPLALVIVGGRTADLCKFIDDEGARVFDGLACSCWAMMSRFYIPLSVRKGSEERVLELIERTSRAWPELTFSVHAEWYGTIEERVYRMGEVRWLEKDRCPAIAGAEG